MTKKTSAGDTVSHACDLCASPWRETRVFNRLAACVARHPPPRGAEKRPFWRAKKVSVSYGKSVFGMW